VVHDIWNVLSRRAPHLELLLVPSAVQGPECVPSLLRALEQVERLAGTENAPDVLIVARGGGSLEDLWGFNDEAVVRAVRASSIPVISAVGHEVDTTLCDFAADLRAPTPSAAAELVSLERDALLAELDNYQDRAGEALLRLVSQRRMRLEQLASRPCLRRPEQPLERAAQSLDLLSDRMERALQRQQERAQARLLGLAGKLEALSPLRVLTRGFAAVSDAQGNVVVRAADVSALQEVHIGFADGTWRAIAQERLSQNP
jgi:exodeoxyribonuclease VII large subunit